MPALAQPQGAETKEKNTVTFRKYSGGKVLDRNTSVINEGLPKPGREAVTPRCGREAVTPRCRREALTPRRNSHLLAYLL